MYINNFFSTPIWSERKADFITSLNKHSNKYIKEARERNKDHIKKYGDAFISHRSTTLLQDNNFLDFKNYVELKSKEFLDHMSYDLRHYNTLFSQMWVQEFAKKGGGHHSVHLHSNQHVSGFYFLKGSDKTSHPIFHDPRTAARSTKLMLKDKVSGTSSGLGTIRFKPSPGLLIIFPGYLEHEFSVDSGIEPFRFIHWNMQAVPKEMAKDV